MSANTETSTVQLDGLVQAPKGNLQVGRVRLNAPADEVWSVVGDFAGFHKFITGLTHIEMTGSGVRSLRKKFFADGSLVVEQLNSHDAQRRVMTWTLIYATFNIENLWARMSVNALGERECEAVWDIVGDPCTGTRQEFEAFIDGFLAMAMGNLDKMFNQ